MISLTINSVTRTLDAWGITEAKLTLTNQNADAFEFTCRRDALGAPAFQFGDTCALLVNGARVFSGLILTNPAFGKSELEGFQYKAAGVWWYLEGTPFTQSRVGFDAAGVLQSSPASQVVLFGQSFASKKSIDEMLLEIALCAGGIAISGTGYTASPPLEEAVDISCAEALRRVLRWLPDVCAGWDYSGTPTLCLYRRSIAPSLNLHLLNDRIVEWTMTPREDLRVEGVVFNYKSVRTVNGKQVSEYKADIVGNPASLRTLHHTFNLAYHSQTGATEPAPAFLAMDYFQAVSALQWEGRVVFQPPELTLGIRPGHTLNLLGGRAELASMQALIQSVDYDLISGYVEIACGPTALLGPSELQSLLDGAKSSGVRDTTIESVDGSAPIISGYLPNATAGPGGTGTTVTTRPPTGDDLLAQATLFPQGAALNISGSQVERTATLMGFDSYVASSPPRKFRRMTAQGSVTNCAWPYSVCDENPAQLSTHYSRHEAYSGEAHYDETSGAVVNNLLKTVRAVDAPWVLGAVSEVVAMPTNWGPMLTQWVTTSPTTADSQTWTWDGAVCWGVPIISSHKIRGIARCLLDQEDTDETAMARATRSASWDSATWSAWTGDGMQSPVSAYWQVRTSGYSFSVRAAKLKVEASGFFGTWEYLIETSAWRRPIGSTAAFTKIDTIQRALQTDSSGAGEVVIEVPNERGFETFLSLPTITSK